MKLKAQAVLLDVEGTTSSIDFVYRCMFPFARQQLHSFCINCWDEPELQKAIDLLALDAGHRDAESWFAAEPDKQPQAIVIEFAIQLMDQDSKATGLKQLQGLLWKAGFEDGRLKAHLFDDVAPMLKRWHDDGLKLAIYSSGSVMAQRMFFGHTIEGDLNPWFSGNFDTTTGGKRETKSYVAIAEQLQILPSEIVFFSDVAEELRAAGDGGLQVIAVVREGNAALPSWYRGSTITSFDQVELVGSSSAQ